MCSVCENCGQRNGLKIGGVNWSPELRKHLCDWCAEELFEKAIKELGWEEPK